MALIIVMSNNGRVMGCKCTQHAVEHCSRGLEMCSGDHVQYSGIYLCSLQWCMQCAVGSGGGSVKLHAVCPAVQVRMEEL